MKKLLILTIIFHFAIQASFANEAQKLSPIQRASLLLNKKYSKLYKPTKLLIGQESTFKVVAEPNSYVALLYSFADSGAEPINGKILRLGSNYKMVKGIVPENGILNLALEIDNDKKLIGKKIYIETITSKDQEFKDFELAKIMGSNAREISYNWIVITKPPKTGGASLAPDLPGASGDAFKTLTQMEKKEKAEDSLEFDKYYNVEYTDYTPLYLRNMKTPELKNNGSGNK